MVCSPKSASLPDKLKQLREVNFYEGTSLTGQFEREEWEKREAEIKSRYADFAALRKTGFSRLSFERRAKAVGLAVHTDRALPWSLAVSRM